MLSGCYALRCLGSEPLDLQFLSRCCSTSCCLSKSVRFLTSEPLDLQFLSQCCSTSCYPSTSLRCLGSEPLDLQFLSRCCSTSFCPSKSVSDQRFSCCKPRRRVLMTSAQPLRRSSNPSHTYPPDKPINTSILPSGQNATLYHHSASQLVTITFPCFIITTIPSA